MEKRKKNPMNINFSEESQKGEIVRKKVVIAKKLFSFFMHSLIDIPKRII